MKKFTSQEIKEFVPKPLFAERVYRIYIGGKDDDR